MRPDDPVWDLTDWFLRVAEALDMAAEARGNTLHYGSAKKFKTETKAPTDRPTAEAEE